MARLLTLGMGGEAWLTFMGNEFGHPEWVDFPREGNGESFQHARRQWSLRDPDAQNYYSDLERFDAALMRADETLGLLASNRVEHKHPHHVQDDTGVLAFHCGGALVVANLHPHESHPAYRVGSAVAGRFRLAPTPTPRNSVGGDAWIPTRRWSPRGGAATGRARE